ncbi:DUF6461 domain-containing protein [Catenuloplanes japonicus]|uniref:DUF6461 domain-containing protein n=1 Tax=Catenuloplanes japonicus TaxID=33876 RepID=UPI000526B446|nr:DUF6461 domain-containing protein [Catenuloplanes japonicus]
MGAEWIVGSELREAYCVSLVRGRSAAGVVEALGGAGVVELRSLHRLVRAAEQVPFRTGKTYRATGMAFVAVAERDGWAVVVEPNGFLFTQAEVYRPLSAGTRVVTVYFSEHSAPLFLLVENGVVQLRMDPSVPESREGADPDAHAEALAALGFRDGETSDGQHRERAFALAERLTGVGLSQEFLTRTTFHCAAVPDPHHDTYADDDARQRLAEYAATNEPAPEQETETDWWDGLVVTDDRLRATGPAGAELARLDLPLLEALSRANDATLHDVAQWARERVFADAGLLGKSGIGAALDHLRRGEPVPAGLRRKVSRRILPLPDAPVLDADGRLDLASRQHLAMDLVLRPPDPDPLTAACDAIAATEGTPALAALRHAFPGLAG